MPAKQININLLGTADLEHTPWGRIVLWATSYGRYIMITTEIVVLMAFISRFSLDRKLTDLTEEIAQKQTIIEANNAFEKEINILQANITSVKSLLKDQEKPLSLVTLFETILPPDVYVDRVEINALSISADVVAGSNLGFSQFLTNLQASKLIKNVTLGDVSKNPTNGIAFHFSADVVGSPVDDSTPAPIGETEPL